MTRYVWIVMPAGYDEYHLIGVFDSEAGAVAEAERQHEGSGHSWISRAVGDDQIDCAGTKGPYGCSVCSIERHEVRP